MRVCSNVYGNDDKSKRARQRNTPLADAPAAIEASRDRYCVRSARKEKEPGREEERERGSRKKERVYIYMRKWRAEASFG